METSFGNWVRRRRKSLDLTQDDLARRVGCSLSAIFKIEADERRPSRQIAELLANHLEISPDQRPLFIKIARREKAVDALDGVPAAALFSPGPPAHLPLPVKPLIGREYELAEITRLVKQPQCRLLTLIGQGGIGKTHLAMGIADSFPPEGQQRRAAFVNLEPVSGREPTISAIANALGIVLYSASDRAEQLISYLRGREMILILDNYEHLTDEKGCVDLVRDILNGAPQVKLIVTSRQPLHLQAEWIFEIQGLPVTKSSDPAVLVSNSSATLFIQRAQQAVSGFTPTTDDLLAIAQICELVEGLPLGIELAAAWVRTLSCQEIAAEIRRSIHFLESAMLDLPERHRSIHATIEYSWKLLSSAEQRALRALSIFRGGFHRQAAEAVAGATLPILYSLISKSLVHRTETGRFDLHGLIQQYAWEQLQAVEQEASAAWQAYSRYYANLLAQRGQALKGADRVAVAAELIAELPNLRRAWERASGQGQADEINQAADSLFWLYESCSNCREGVPLFDVAVQSLRAGEPGDRAGQLAFGQALCYKGFFLYRQGQHPQGRAALSSSLELLKALPGQADRDLSMAVSNATVFLGTVISLMGEYEEGDRLLREGLALKQDLGDLWGAAYCLRQIGLFAFHYKGDYESAYQAVDQSLAMSKRIGNAWSTAASLSQLGLITCFIGDYEQAEGHLGEALALSRRLEDRASIALALDCLGLVKIAQWYFAEGQALLQESIALWMEIGERGSLAQTLAHLGSAHHRQGSYAEARAIFQEAIQIANEMQTIPVLLEGLLGLAEVDAGEGNVERAFELACAVASNHSASFDTITRANGLRGALEEVLPAQRVRVIRDRTALLSLATLI